jgi:conjugative relaxase-like TrwC/TraI family protein
VVASIAKVGRVHTGSGSGVGLDYYLSYVERGGEAGRWLGAAADRLGLVGEVAAVDLLAVGEGRVPGEGGGRLIAGREGRVPAWDVTFSAPKSISVLYGLADEPARQLLRDAHDGAVAAAVGWLETNAGRARRGHAGQDGHVPVELVVAGFVHGTSRALDPDMHTHCLVANLGRDDNGRWSSIDSRVIYRQRMAAGAVYRAELRRVTAEVGLRWRAADHRGLSELAELPHGLLRQFSKRRMDIEGAMAERGGSGPRAAEAAALATRVTKVDVEFAERCSSWRDEAAGHGWTAERANELVLGPDGCDPTLRRALGRELSAVQREQVVAMLLGPEGLTRDQAAFRRGDVLRAWAAQLPLGASPGQLEQLVDFTLARSEVVPLVVADATGAALTREHRADSAVVRLIVAAAPSDALAEPRYTTTEMLGVEARLLNTAVAGKGVHRAQIPKFAIEAAIVGRGLSDEQADMVRAICGSGDAVSVVVGVPGSGKTFALGVARELWETYGYHVMGVALAGRAADELAQGAGIGCAQTIDSFLIGSDQPVGDRSVIIVDEASLADTRRLAAVVDSVGTGAKIVTVGDDRQIAPIEAGGALLALANRVGAVRLGDNRRQVERWQRDALAAIRDGRAAEAAKAYLTQGHVTVADTAGELMGVMVGDWWAARQGGQDASMWAYTLDGVAELNARARAHLVAAGHLGEREIVAPSSVRNQRGERCFAAGDEIVCLRNLRRFPDDPSGRGVRNGTLAVVVDVDGRGLAVHTADGRDLLLPYGYVADWVDHSYAMTVHKTQGRTLGEVDWGQDNRRQGHAFVYGAAGLAAEAALVAASRATDTTDLYVLSGPPPEPTSHGTPERVDAQVQLERAWSSSQAKTTASDLLVNAERVRQLAGLPTDELRAKLAGLALLDPGQERGLTESLADAEYRLGVAGAVLADTPLGPAADQASRDGAAALEDVRYYTERLAHRDQLVANWGDDLFAAGVERATLTEALRTQRRWRQTAVAADPPGWLTELLGPAPVGNRGRTQLWWEGLSATLDIRERQGLDDHSPGGQNSDSVWRRAIGVAPDSLDAAPWRSAIASIRRAQVTLSMPARVDDARPMLGATPPIRTRQRAQAIPQSRDRASGLDRC